MEEQFEKERSSLEEQKSLLREELDSLREELTAKLNMANSEVQPLLTLSKWFGRKQKKDTEAEGGDD